MFSAIGFLLVPAITLSLAAPTNRTAHFGAWLGREAVILGGLDESKRSDPRRFETIPWAFDPQTLRWRSFTAMPQGRAFAGAATLGGKLYVAGGLDDDQTTLRTVVRFDPGPGRWESVAPMLEARSRFALLAVGGKLVAIGGLGHRSDGYSLNLSSVGVYDPATNAWQAGPPLMIGRHGLSVATDGKTLVVVGGYGGPSGDQLADMELLRWGTPKWVAGPKLPAPRGFSGLSHTPQGWLLVGGRPNGAHPLLLSPQGKAWIELPVQDLERNRFVVLSQGENLWVFGGEGSAATFVTRLRREASGGGYRWDPVANSTGN